jgi:peptidoglycan/LPS O-acetylase OafA/YrhL
MAHRAQNLRSFALARGRQSGWFVKSPRIVEPAGLQPLQSVAKAVARRLDYVDGLRAIAALWVVLHHAAETSVPARTLSVPWVGPIVATLFFGQWAVIVFLVLSGFCLYYPCARKDPAQPRLSSGYGRYLARRWFRIAPAYVAACLLCLLMAAFPSLRTGRWQGTGPVYGATVVTHLLLVHNLFPAYATKIDYPMWSIGLEWQIYLLFPAVAWAFRRSSGLVVTAVLLVTASLIRLWHGQCPGALSTFFRDGPIAYLFIFSAGMLAASLIVRGHEVTSQAALGVVAVAAMTSVRLGSGNGLVHDVATCAAAFCILVLAARAGSATGRWLSAPPLVAVGVWSYSIYLVHAPLMHLCWLALLRLHLSADTTFAALLGALPPVIALSYGFHRLLERPFIRDRASITAGRAPAAPSSSGRPRG